MKANYDYHWPRGSPGGRIDEARGVGVLDMEIGHVRMVL